MSKVAIKGNASGTGTFTLEAPNSNTDRTLTLPDEAGTVLTSASDIPSDNLTGSVTVDGSGNVGINTTSALAQTSIKQSADNKYQLFLEQANAVDGYGIICDMTDGALAFSRYASSAYSERMRIDPSGHVLVGKTVRDSDTQGHQLAGANGEAAFTRTGDIPLVVTRNTNDGILVLFRQDASSEGTIEVSGTTVTYNGGHLGRWSRLVDNTKDTSIVKGTVMTNLDEMIEWSHDAVEAQNAVYDEEGSLVSEAVEAKEAYTEDNEQLNKMAVSSVEGDANVSGVFVKWDEEDGFNDFTIAMTGDMVIRIAQGTTVARGDLLMSAGDGTAKPQDDDIVRSKTIAKVTSTNVSHTYDDGSYLVPCVLMAC